MSMVPNKDYLDGYNDCVKETDRYHVDVMHLFVRVVEAHCDKESLTRSGLKDEVADYLLDGYRCLVEKHSGEHRVSGHVEAEAKTRVEELEDMLKRVLHAHKRFQSQHEREEMVLRMQAQTLLGEPLADYVHIPVVRDDD
jgi:hypothetical protein